MPVPMFKKTSDIFSTVPDSTPQSRRRYANKAAYDHYMNSDAFLNCDALRNPQSTTRPPYIVTWSESALLSRPDRLPSSALRTRESDLRNRVEHPYILFATITDSNPKHIGELEPYGAAIVDSATKNEPDTIFYADARPLDLETGQVTDSLTGEKDGFICALEVYASKEACDAHLQDESVKNLAVQGHKLGSRFELVPMVMKEGWLVRE
ncbi:hypothetical protein LTR05_008646 [Lithohypha guttulata]|uniref:ABM domain-containing protein n=1 Tax=Lithohypha guttulata TaxID=1690604 RepID=A0AAN7SRW5_9EURO|nr:hypothetical protein LTR05_008646 [Lithohypha guttulata]